MKKAVLTFILALIMVAPALCETSVWVAKTDSSVMYIGGTIHILRESDKPFPSEFEKAYNKSEAIVLETDLDKMATPETQQSVMAKAVYSDGRTLDKVLSEDAYKMLDKYCTNNGLSLAAMNHLKPSIIMLTLVGLELQKLGVNQDGIDIFYHGKAKADKKTIGKLETVEEQIELLTSMGDGNESAFIIYSIDEMKKIEELFDKIVVAWRTGDEKSLYDQFIVDMKEDFPNLYKIALVDRNINWMPKIEQYLLTSETEFVMVGAAHLVGEEGVIEQLKKLGYKVEKFK